MKSNNDILLQILTKIAEMKDPSDLRTSKVLSKNPSLEGKTFSKSELILAYKSLLGEGVKRDLVKEKQVFEALKMKKVRTLSGVTPVTVLTKPFPCPGKCIYCPNDAKMPKSYLSSEPGAQRAFNNKFDPYLQLFNRLVAYRNIGHPTDKVELIVLGGTWSYYPKSYQVWFIKRCFDALNNFHPDKADYAKRVSKEKVCSWTCLFRVQRKNESAKSRCVGLVLETRPDFVNQKEVVTLRKLGATKIQIGVQSLNEKVLKVNKRGHGVDSTARAFKLLRQAGFKIHVHWMPNLLGSTPQKDIEDYEKLFTDIRFKPDEIKIYPCSLIAGTGLIKYYEERMWKPYTEKQLISVLKKCVESTPRWCRITRMVRDISSADIVVGNKKSNIRQVVERELEKSGKKINEIRYREIKGEKVTFSDLKLVRNTYETSVSEELFLEYVTHQDKIVGFMRLSIPKAKNPIEELGNSSIIREVHVYGQTLDIGLEESGSSQHIGIGKKLIDKAKDITKDEGLGKVSVISSVGTRAYYEKLGFGKGVLYQNCPKRF